MKIIVGLGNPGPEYALTRHNIGFLAIDSFLQRLGSPREKTEKKALVARANLEGESLILCKPMNYMNLSGQPVNDLMAYYKVDIEDLLVIHDDLDQEFGSFKFQKNRGAGGHNGIKDIHQKLATKDYARLKVGVGKPPGRQEVSSYVLSKFKKEELELLQNELLSDLDEAIKAFIVKGFRYACDHFNGRRE